MIRRLLLLTLLVSVNTHVKAAGIDIRLGDEVAHFEYLFDDDSQIGIGGATVGAALLFNENDDIAFSIGALITGSSAGRNRALQFGAGARLYVAQLDREPGMVIDGVVVAANDNDETIASLAIGGSASYIFPSRTPMAISIELFYAPNITSFADNEDVVDAQIRFELEVAPSTRIYLGYRDLEAKMESSGLDYVLDDSAHFGVRFSY